MKDMDTIVSPLISVIVPCYNQAQYLDECLQSVLDQTFQDWECLIVNDGSPDHTEEVAKRWVEKDPRFKYLFRENKGVSAARNFGIENAHGEWILPLDADDYIGDQYLEFSVDEIKKGYDLIYYKMRVFGSINADYSATYNYDELLYANPFYCSCVFPKWKWAQINGYDENLIYGKEDWEFCINMIYNTTTKVTRNDYVGFYYRTKEVSRQQVLQNDEEKNILSKEYICRKHAHHYAKSGAYVLRNIRKVEEYRLQIEYYHKIIYDNPLLKTLNKVRKFLKVRI